MKNVFLKVVSVLLAFASVCCVCSCEGAGNANKDVNGSEIVSEVTDKQTQVNSGANFDTSSTKQDSLSSVSADYTVIALADGATQINGDGASVSGNTVTINAEGGYQISGTLSNGKIIVDVDANVHLVLSGVSITSQDSAPLAIFGKKKKTVTVADSTVNTLTDASSYTSFYKAEDEEPNACLFCKNDLTINGGGSLTVNASFNNGIGSKDELKILGGNITVSAVNNGLKGNDYVYLLGGQINITSQGDGIKADSTDEGMGNVYIGETVSVNVNAACDGIQAYNALSVTGGTVNVKTYGGAAANTSVHTDNMFTRPGSFNPNTTVTDTDESRKGLKSDFNLLIEGGQITVDSYDDAVHAGDSLIVSGGSLSIKTGDDGLHADLQLSVTGGTVEVTQCYEGLEAAKISVLGGSVSIVATDDGVNAADGTATQVGVKNGNCYLYIGGGTIIVNASGDGLDSNGDLVIDGGTVTVFGPTDNGNGSLDADGTIYINGGTVAAIGSSGMLELPSTGSAQYVISCGVSVAANTQLSVSDSGGNVLWTATGIKSAQSLIISLPSFEAGKTYSVSAGTATYTVTLSSKITSAGGSTGGFQGGGRR